MNTEVPDANRGQRTLAAIVLTDAVGFSARMSMDEEDTLALIQRDLSLMERLCQRFEGRVIKSTGDGLLMYFVSAVQAMNCSLKIQQELHQLHRQKGSENTLQHRIGVHLGDVFINESDVMGTGVNIAARLQTEAFPGGICISQIVYDVVKSRLDLNATYAGPLQLKNIREPQPAYHINPIPNASPAPVSTPTGPSVDAAQPLSPNPEESPDSGSSSRDPLTPGTKVGGRYTIQRVIGQGGFGRSYLVEDTQRFGEPCVLKEFFPANNNKSSRSLQKALDLFKREAKTLYQINHPQVPKFWACFTQGKRLFIVQEYIDGVTYSQLIKQRKRDGVRFSEVEVLRWLMHMLQVLDYLHGLNLVHRDISPDNIIYSRDRNLPVLIDFGLVNDAMTSLLSEDHEDGKSGTMVGKFGYSPPEQIQLGQCFPCSDLYALGVTTLVLLTGRYPRDLMDRSTLDWRWQDYAQVSPGLTAILQRLLQQRPTERFQTAREVLEIVIPLLSGQGGNLQNQASSPLPQYTAAAVDLTIDPTVAPVFEALMQGGQSVLRDPAFIEQCRQELTRCVGPMANFLLEDVLEQHPNATPQELVEHLAAQLSDGKQASEFATSVHIPPPSGGVKQPGAGITRLQRGSLGGAEPASVNSGIQNRSGAEPAALSPEFVERCRRALVQCVGPMADFLLEETLADYPNLGPQGLVAQLATEIPDARKAQEFQQQLL
mgnify:CR=1 FL=1